MQPDADTIIAVVGAGFVLIAVAVLVWVYSSGRRIRARMTPEELEEADRAALRDSFW